MSRARLKEVYEKAGGPAQVERLLNAFYRKMADDLLIGFFFVGKDLAAIAQNQHHFIRTAAGLETDYRGKSPSTAHIQLPPILRGHFDRRLVILREILADHGLSEEDTDLWIAFEESFRGVVEAKD